MTDPHTTIVIVGAGFSGTVTAAHLLRRDIGTPLRVVLINRSGPFARGVAYGTGSSHHVLNVPAGRMSAFASDEDDFLRFARTRDASIAGGSFVPRQLYGQYLEHVLVAAERQAAPGTRLEHVADEAIAIETSGDGATATVVLAGGERVRADHVVVALGNYAPSNPPVADEAFYGSKRYVRDPWAPGALEGISDDAPVLLIGTGLTMVDVALELAARPRTAPLLAVSRRGLLPQPHRPSGAPPSYGHLPPELVACPATALDYLRAVRRHVKRVGATGIDWRDVVASLRPVTPRLWARLTPRERARFLRHLRPYWDAHRHRMAPELWHAIHDVIGLRGLRVMAGRLLDYAEERDGVEVGIRHRGTRGREAYHVAAVVNCTGPESDVRALRDRLISDLARRGLARADVSGLGFDVDDSLALLDARGHPSPVLSLVGPLLKGKYWEATAVPELRVHAATVADRLAKRFQAGLERRTA